MMKYEDYLEYLKSYNELRSQNTRYQLGRYFINRLTGGPSHPEIYYEKNDSKAHDLFFDRFVDMGAI